MMAMQDWKVGMQVPLDGGREPLGPFMAETWFILLAKPAKERALARYLEKAGCVDVWRPVEKIWVPQPRSARKIEREVSVAPGYVFALMDRQPAWDVIKHQAETLARGVVSLREQPCAISVKDMAEMTKVPERIAEARKQDLHERELAEARALQERLANAPRAGEAAEIIEGPLTGFTVDVVSIDRGIAHFVLGSLLGGGAASASLASLKRVAK